MGRVILGKMSLRWCGNCDLPIIEERECSICHTPSFSVKHTPPGDVRPAFESDILMIKDVIASQFGDHAAEKMIGKNDLVILNNVPSLDRMDEIIVHGWVIGNIKYKVPTERFIFIPNQFGLFLLNGNAERNIVMVDDDAVPFIMRGASCLVPGIKGVIGEFEAGDEVLVTDRQKKILMSGTAQMGHHRMITEKKGVAVKSRRRVKETDFPHSVPESDPTWKLACRANEGYLEKMVNEAKRFIKRIMKETDLPAAVSYSGGKDSLATLLLVLEAGFRPDLLFINTGLELPETVENVEKVVKEYDLKLVSFNAGDAFYRALEYFGPPAKDFRWCCKICKLGPAARLINKEYPNGLLSFIGQRQYESRQRKEKGRKWINPWVPNQKGVSPIQRWNALTVWLYLFLRDAPYNPWYERGLERIGCWLCPASSVADLNRIRDGYKDSKRFFGFLERWTDKKGFSPEWARMGLWRWKRYPGTVKQMLDEVGIEPETLFHSKAHSSKKDELRSLDFNETEARMGDDDIYTIEGTFEREILTEDVAKLAPILGSINVMTEERLIVETDGGGEITIGRNTLRVSGKKEMVEKDIADAVSVLKRALFCVGCGVCLGRCPAGALSLERQGERERIHLDDSLCVGCRECLGPCPVENFSPHEEHRF